MPLERIVTAALQIVDEDGPEALSMRSLAGRLDTGTAVLYRAVSGRSELIGHVIDAVLGEAVFALDRGSDESTGGPRGWESICRDAALTLFECLSRHPGVAALLIEQVPTGAHALMLRERLLAVLLGAGFAPADASRIYATIARLVVGFAAQLHIAGALLVAEQGEISELFRGLDPTRYPATIAVADVLPRQTLEAEFRFALDLVIAGLSAQHHL